MTHSVRPSTESSLLGLVKSQIRDFERERNKTQKQDTLQLLTKELLALPERVHRTFLSCFMLQRPSFEIRSVPYHSCYKGFISYPRFGLLSLKQAFK
jgi:hypothetical protein